MLVRDVLAGRRGQRLSRTDGRYEVLVGRVDGRVGERREVPRAVAKLVLDGERRQAAEATARSFLLLESLCQQASLQGERIQRGERGRHLAGARAGEVVQRQTARAAVVRGVERVRAEVQAAGAIGSVDAGSKIDVGRTATL